MRDSSRLQWPHRLRALLLHFPGVCIASALACTPTAQHPSVTPSPTAKAAVSARPTAAPEPNLPMFARLAPDSAWHDFDELPPGALRRLGTARLSVDAASVAIDNEGRAWYTDADRGIVVLGLDGKYRVYDPRPCAGSHDQFRHVAEGMRVVCEHAIRTITESGVKTVELPRSSKCSLSADGNLVACMKNLGTMHKGNCDACTAWDERLVVWRVDGTPVWELDGNFDDVQKIRLTNAGDALLVRAKAVSLFSKGREKWSIPMDISLSLTVALAPDQTSLLGRDGTKSQWFRIQLSDGREVHRSPPQPYLLTREIAPLPTGNQAYVSLAGTFGSSNNVRAVVDMSTGAIVHRWDAPHMEWSNAVSPNGKFAASVGLGHFVRVRLDQPALAADASPVAETPQRIAISPDKRVVATFGDGQYDEHVTLYDAQTGAARWRVQAPEFAEQLLFSEDGTRLAVSARFGGYSLLDSATGKTACTSEAVAGAELFWKGNRLLAVYPGDNGDDCDEITPASVTLVDDKCKVLHRYEVHGMIEVLERKTDAWTISAAKWKHACGDNYELLPAEKWSIDLKTGAKTVLGPYATPKKHDEEEGESSEDGDLVAQETVLSADGKTKLAWQTWSGDGNKNVATIACLDVATGKVLAKYPAPLSAGPIMAITREGEWMAIADRTSVLVYSCRN